MAINRNTDTANEIRDVLKLQQNVDGVIENVAGQIIPVVDINPNHSRICDVVEEGTGNATILTVPSNKVFFLNSVSISAVNDADTAIGSYRINLTMPSGATKVVIRVNVPKLGVSNNSISFNRPIKILSGGTITSTLGGTLSSGFANISGYYVDNPNA